MTLLSKEEFAKLQTRDGLQNWLVPGVKVRCVNKEVVNKTIAAAMVFYNAPHPGFDLDEVQQILFVLPDSRNKNWLRFTLVNTDLNWKWAPEDKDGNAVWEPVE